MLQRFVHYELRVCRLLNRGCQIRGVHACFAVVSRLGDGIFWYSLMLALPLAFGRLGLAASVHMLLVGLGGLMIYLLIKQGTERPRPFSISRAIRQGALALDKYSFPSGHTLHAVSLTLVAIQYLPMLIWLLLPFVILTALSRVVLGLHYPTDVFAGAVLGLLLAMGSFQLVPGLFGPSPAIVIDADLDDF
jgi:undecaprenyl-diphosphatase